VKICYYSCIYDVLKDPIQHKEKATRLNHLKAKIVILHKAAPGNTRDPATFQGKAHPSSTFYRCENGMSHG